MNIREAIKEDAKQLECLLNGLSYYYVGSKEDSQPEWLSESLTVREFENRIENDRFINLVCETRDNIIGYISIKNKSHLYHLFVSKKYQRNGIAKKLWETVKNMTQSPKYTVRSSLYAVPVYEKFGFHRIGEVMAKDNIQFQEMALINTD